MNLELDETRKELASAKEESEYIQKDFETQVTVLTSNFKELEQKLDSLTQENSQLKKQHENNLVVISSLQNQIDEQSIEARSLSLLDPCAKGELESIPAKELMISELDMQIESQEAINKALEAKEQEIQEERVKYKAQIEQYNTNLDMLVQKIQILVKINENLTKDMEYERYEYTNYRAAVWSVYQQAKRCLENVKYSDTEVEKYFKAGEDNLQRDFDTLLHTYYAIRNETMKIDAMLEERKFYL